jgi:hypothetical protein
LDSDPLGCAVLAALLSCLSRSGVRGDSGELIVSPSGARY